MRVSAAPEDEMTLQVQLGMIVGGAGMVGVLVVFVVVVNCVAYLRVEKDDS